MISDVSFVSKVSDVAAFEELLFDYYSVVLKAFEAAGGPVLSPEDLVRSSIDHLDEMLPPDGRLALARGQDRHLVGCGAMRRIRQDAVEMKRMFVRPEVQGQGLGRRLFE
ncbi:GNAT family N-acetyltransferase, partial [Ruegeria sp. 2205SS24-7]|uniref:GNAT family N-acetyltransferase n=2 Tax=Ruegeria discodermiae TaxID=3064389 RepID=UPI002741A27D